MSSSATHRSISRLPLEVFQDLGKTSLSVEQTQTQSREQMEKMRYLLSSKLQKIGVNTVGDLLNISNPSLLKCLSCFFHQNNSGDSSRNNNINENSAISSVASENIICSDFTHVDCQIFLQRIYNICSVSSQSALDLLIKERNRDIQRNEDNSNTSNKRRRNDHRGHYNGYYNDYIVSQNTKSFSYSIPSGVQSLDQNLRGGFRIGSITELVGRAGVGKTQFAMQLCVMAAKLNMGAVYIDTENKISLSRLKEIAQHRKNISENNNNNIYNNNNSASLLSYKSYKDPNILMENITIHRPTSTLDMLDQISKLEEDIILRNHDSSIFVGDQQQEHQQAKFPIGLIVVDSIAAPTKRDFGKDTATERVKSLFQIAQHLKRMADQLNLVVLVINQVGLQQQQPGQTHQMNTNTNTSNDDFVAVQAALGNSWHHCVSTRLLLEYTKDPHQSVDDGNITHNNNSSNRSFRSEDFYRTASIVKSNVVGESKVNFQITSIGVSDF